MQNNDEVALLSKTIDALQDIPNMLLTVQAMLPTVDVKSKEHCSPLTLGEIVEGVSYHPAHMLQVGSWFHIEMFGEMHLAPAFLPIDIICTLAMENQEFITAVEEW